MNQPTRDPRQPFGAPAAHQQPAGAYIQPTVPAPQIDPPRHRAPWIIVGIAVAVSLAIVSAVLFFDNDTSTSVVGSTLSPQPAIRVTTPKSSANPWKFKDSSGSWEIHSETWVGNQVTLDISVTCDVGDLSWTLFAFMQDESLQVDPEPSGPEPYLAEGSCSAGQTQRGYATLNFPKRSAGMLILGTRINAISGLTIKG